ncbi:AbiH family protein [Devosia insulae]|uniref:AbiH family protein n=1 Tax=Devosia insulae TaxID=408174 RepID=UPI000A06E204|nr:AbiH family protein [Devosia insulae]
MSKRLYIVGNGFDRHHGIPSDYSEFGAYLKGVDDDRVYRTVFLAIEMNGP